jgi:hypothetical protein
VSLGARDREAFDLVRSRSFADAYVASLDLELQARRLTLRIYGSLRPSDASTVLATITFFGTGEFRIGNEAGAFPESVRLASLALAYDDASDRGSAELAGRAPWSSTFGFDGLAYEEHAAVLASLADDDALVPDDA